MKCFQRMESGMIHVKCHGDSVRNKHLKLCCREMWGHQFHIFTEGRQMTGAQLGDRLGHTERQNIPPVRVVKYRSV